MRTEQKNKKTIILITVMAALLALSGIAYIGWDVFLIVFFVAVYFVTRNILKRPWTSLTKKILFLIGVYCAILFGLYIVMSEINIMRLKWMILIILASGWPLILYGAADLLEKLFPERKAIRTLLYVMAVAAGIFLDIVMRSDGIPIRKGSMRLDYILYYLVIAAAIGYIKYIADIEHKGVRISLVAMMAVLILGIMTAVIFFDTRWRDIAVYICSYLSGREAPVDWVGYRMAALRAYWLHDFDLLRTQYPNGGYFLAMDSNVPVILAHRVGAWTSVVLLAMEAGISIGFGLLYSAMRKKGIPNTWPDRVWNAVPFLILGYALRTVIGMTENMFMFHVWKMDMPFTGSASIDLAVLVVLLFPLFFTSKDKNNSDA